LAYLGVQTLGMKDSGDYLIFRGFTSPTTLWNGFRIEDATPSLSYANGGVWMDNVERLDVIKGPSSILYGRAEPGGAVNVLTKRPQADFRGEVNAGGGYWANRWLGLDVTGSFNEDKTVLGRINLAQEDSDSWYRYGPKYHSQGVAPALEWHISPQTTLSLEGQYRNVEGGTNAQQYIPIDPATGQPLAVDPSLTMMPGNISRYRQNRTYLALDHQFTPEWAVSLKYMRNDANNPYYRNNLAAGGSLFPLGPGQTFMWVFGGQNRQTTNATILDVTGHVEALGIKHTLLLGMDYYKKQFDQLSGADWAQTADYLNPALPTPVALTDTWSLRNRESAWYVQDQMELLRNWHLLLGGRQQSIYEHNISNMPSMFSPPQDVIYQKSVFLPRLGLLWQARPWLSTYYSYAENTGSSNGLAFTGTPIKPESSKQHELGIKSTWLDERLTANLALFELTKFNIASADPAHIGFNIGVGEVKSTGYELNLQGALTPAWNLLTNYSHARPYVVTGAAGAAALQPQSIVAGQLLPYVSNDTLSVWTSYKLLGETLAGWKVGGGANWASAPNMNAISAIPTHAYTVASAFASYETKLGGHKTTLQLNINNLFNKKYMTYQGDDVNGGFGGNTLAGSWGTPRQVRLSVRSEF
jgi:iron complex outermembrane receptor protein